MDKKGESMVLKREIVIPELTGDKKRRLYIYLPEDYETSGKRYPVLYMFDGQNVFFDEDASFGKSMGMNDYMQLTNTPLIICAVQSNTEGHERLSEYAPVDFVYGPVGEIKAKGDVYMNWLVKTLKPFIDKEFRTLPEREHAAISGTSMGGLMALYGACVFGHVFKKAACLSASVWIAPEKILSVLKNGNIKKDAVVYIDYGSKEMKNHRESREALMRVTEFLMEKDVNVTLRIIPGGTHSEESWERQIPVFMECLKL